MTVAELISALQRYESTGEVFVDVGKYEAIVNDVRYTIGGDITLYLRGPAEESR